MKISQKSSLESSLNPREVKRTSDFVAIVSRYVKLRRAGSQYVGSCPFHSESSPSFFIEPQQKIWKCFGCDAGGDLFDFIMRVEVCDFSGAVKIAAAFGVATASEPRSGSRSGWRVGAQPLGARSAPITSPQSSRASILASLDATERRNAAIQAANAVDALEFATACEPDSGEGSQFIRHRITSTEGRHGRD
jgi:hypothetical protein